MAKRRIITLAKPEPPPKAPPAPPPSPVISKTRLAKARLKAASAWLEATWPLAFRSPIRPLAIGAGLEIAAHPSGGFTADERHAALRAWTGRWDYQKAITAGRLRVKLDGTDATEVTEPEREHARERLKALEARRPPDKKDRCPTKSSGPND